MSIYYLSDLKNNPFKDFAIESQQNVVFNNKVYKVLTYQVPSDWSYTTKTLCKMFWASLGQERYQAGENTRKSYIAKAFSRHRTKQVVVPQNDVEKDEQANLAQVDKESRLERLLYWKDIILSPIGLDMHKAYFLSKHFSKIPPSSNFTKICLQPVYETRSTVVFLPSGSFSYIADEITQLTEDKVLVLFYAAREWSDRLGGILSNKRLLQNSAACSETNGRSKKFRVFGLEQDKALPFPQKLIDMFSPIQPESGPNLT